MDGIPDKRRTSVLIACLVAMFGLPCFAQTPSPGNNTTGSVPKVAPKRDSQALAVLANAVTALGGEANIAALHDCTASGSFTSGGDTWLRFTSFTWKNAADQYSYEVVAPDGKKSIDHSGHGKPSIEMDGKKRPRHDHSPISASPVHLAATRLVLLLHDQKFDVVLLGATVLNGAQVLKVRTQYNLNEVEASLTQQDWYFDQNYLPVRVEYQVGEAHNAADLTKLAADLSGYAPVNGVMVPMQITFWMNGKMGATATISNIAFNSGLSSSEFD